MTRAIDSQLPATSEANSAHRLHSHSEALIAAGDLAQIALTEATLRDAESKPPQVELEHFSRSGLAALLIPSAQGGPGLGLNTLAEVLRVIAQADPALSQILHGHFTALATVLEAAPANTELLKAIVQGQRLGSTRTQDPAFSLDSQQQLSGEARHEGGAFSANWLVLPALNAAGQTFWAVLPSAQPSVQLQADRLSLGQRSSAQGTLRLQAASITNESLIPRPSLSLVPAIARLLHGAIAAGIARAALEDATHFVRHSARPWIDAKTDKAGDDPYTIAEFGRLYLELDAAESLLERSAKTLDRLWQQPLSLEAINQGLVAATQAQSLSSDVALLSSEKLFELAGSRATLSEYRLDRHWRNARTHSLQEPQRWSYYALGYAQLNHTFPAAPSRIERNFL